jgi:hypothetical protein
MKVFVTFEIMKDKLCVDTHSYLKIYGNVDPTPDE